MPAARKKPFKTMPPVGPTFNEGGSKPAAALPDVIETIMPAVVNIYVAKGDDASSGSGFVIDGKAGYIVTNNHVIDDGSKIVVSFPDDNAYTAKLVGSDPMTDIAVLKLQKMKGPVPQATMGDSDLMRLGNSVVVIGNPFSFKNSVSTGIVSGLHRTLGNSLFDDYIQTDAAMNPGNSGGPLFNMGGQVVGVNTAIISGSGSSAGIGFAIPAKQVRWTVEQIVNHGVVRRAVMGIGIAPVTSGLAEKFGLAARQGVHVSSIVKNGPSWRAGLRRNDVILSMNEHDIASTAELRAVVAGHMPDDNIEIVYWRGGERHNTTLKLGEAVLRKPEAANDDEEDEDDITDLVLGALKEKLKEELKDELRAELMQEFSRMFGPGNARPLTPRPVRPQAPRYKPKY